MTRRILKKGICHYCGEEKYEFTKWPSSISWALLCDDCSEDFLTPEAHKKRTGKTPKRKKIHGYNNV